MIQEILDTTSFKEGLRSSLEKKSLNYYPIKVAARKHVYICGDRDNMIYFIERGQVKLVTITPEGKECILAIHSQGDIFGELCLTGLSERQETATAMQQTNLMQIPSANFCKHLANASLLESFIQYLTLRISDQQQVIANLVTIDSEQRLGKTLLQLATSLGKPHLSNTLVELKISHEELSEMVGTTRPRISLFMQRFRQLGLVEMTKQHYLIIKEKNLANYLSQIA